jgi:hypothetical protein
VNKKLLIALLLLVPPAFAGGDNQWVLEQCTLTYHGSHPLHQTEGVSHAARGKGVCHAGQCDFLIAVPVKQLAQGVYLIIGEPASDFLPRTMRINPPLRSRSLGRRAHVSDARNPWLTIRQSLAGFGKWNVLSQKVPAQCLYERSATRTHTD